ncbi:hypothetical protein DUNSADRAFT_17829 [Dunaliella salina]|uniref:Uncharacterized protein n=1 Tax=Dunaliella salina TaxID=3046 RepID=A0ABQ7GZQ9_DUNSA|nr:hypothetical protein DUNSADRAFT_17829 [Dunaliella salina]|eukprot:KAF5840095.1 hypothetical protein DUNSADRAFT_17829 [Dunaliella salina]
MIPSRNGVLCCLRLLRSCPLPLTSYATYALCPFSLVSLTPCSTYVLYSCLLYRCPTPHQPCTTQALSYFCPVLFTHMVPLCHFCPVSLMVVPFMPCATCDWCHHRRVSLMLCAAYGLCHSSPVLLLPCVIYAYDVCRFCPVSLMVVPFMPCATYGWCHQRRVSLLLCAAYSLCHSSPVPLLPCVAPALCHLPCVAHALCSLPCVAQALCYLPCVAHAVCHLPCVAHALCQLPCATYALGHSSHRTDAWRSKGLRSLSGPRHAPAL